MWVVWTKAEALARCGGDRGSFIDLYQNQWRYHSAFENREEAEQLAKELTTEPNLDYNGPGGQCVMKAICRPAGHNANWEY